MAVKKFDLVIYGASSFVGQILTEYLYEHIGLTRKVKWAIAGRSETKLNELRDSLGEGAAKLPIIIADSHDESGLRDMCERSRVIISTGPMRPATKVAAFLLDTDTSRSWASPHLSQVTRVASTNATSHEFAGIVVLLPSAGTPAVPFSVLPPHLCIETTNYWRI